ncbi:MAG: oxygenase MpaB family protein [Pelobium sp.]
MGFFILKDFKTFHYVKAFFELKREMIDLKSLDNFRKIGDPLADQFVDIHFSNSEKKSELYLGIQSLRKNSDWALFIKSFPDASWFDQEFSKSSVPDVRQIKSAVQFYKSKELYISQLLGLLSLPYCYAAADGAKVLYQTERMYKDVNKRLEETGAFVADIMSKNAFSEDGKGKVQLFKVRLMHAVSRHYILKGNWDLKLGYPINQEDMLGTNLSFSLIVIRGLRKMGFDISYEQQMAYINYWSWIGELLGIQPALLPNDGKEAHNIEEAISKRQFKSSEEGKQLTKSLLECFYKLNTSQAIKNNEIPAFMRFLLGDAVSTILDLPPGSFPASKKIMLKFKTALNP